MHITLLSKLTAEPANSHKNTRNRKETINELQSVMRMRKEICQPVKGNPLTCPNHAIAYLNHHCAPQPSLQGWKQGLQLVGLAHMQEGPETSKLPAVHNKFFFKNFKLCNYVKKEKGPM